MCELMTVNEAAQFLRISRRSLYEMTRARVRAKQKHPLPLVRLNSNCLRFVKSELEIWILKLSQENSK
jgi:excisionase family DNA binding protein